MFRSKQKFVTGNSNGSLSLFDKNRLLKSKSLAGIRVMVAYFNGQIVAAAKNGKLTIMNEDLETLKEIPGTREQPLCITGNATYLVMSDWGGFVRYYKRNSNEQSKVFFSSLLLKSLLQTYMHLGRTESVHVANNLVLSGSADNTLQAFDMEKHQKLWEFDNEHEIRGSVLLDDKLLACSDKVVIMLAWEKGELLQRLNNYDYCYNIDLSPNGSLLAVACNSAVALWDIKNAVRVKEFKLGTNIFDLRFNPSGDKLIAGTNDGEIFEIEMK